LFSTRTTFIWSATKESKHFATATLLDLQINRELRKRAGINVQQETCEMNFVPARKYLSLACAFVALAAVGASPALAQTVHQKTPQSSQQLYLSAPGSKMSRDDALRDCNAEASKFSNSSAETEQLSTYRSCMASHGQTE
jgi:hypothetical protein